MSDDLEVFDATLKEFAALRAPGVSGSRIKKLTKIAVDNVQKESQIVQKLYIHCKGIQPSHKLGALYVVDSVVRSYVDQARSANQVIEESAPDGTFAAGAFKFQSLIENIIDDALSASDEQSEKISKLVGIWETHKTFSEQVIKSIKAKHFTSTTPPGSPPKKASAVPAAPAVAAPASNDPRRSAPAPAAADKKDPSSILQALASLANTNPTAQAAQASPAPSTMSPPAQTPQPAANDPTAIFKMLQNLQGANAAPGMPAPGMPAPGMPAPGMAAPGGAMPNQYGYRDERRGAYRDRDDRRGRRERSRSPQRRGGRERDHPPQPGTGEGERNVPGTPHYRQKYVTTDPSIPAGSIKVLSRTIFIGGVPQYMSEQELMTELRPYAEVQSVILNNERKHAFVKVYSRQEAESVIASFSQQNTPSSLRARWGVGFGPRDCCDYQVGISTIPISRLTDADRRWAVAAEWGGTGGQPLNPGLVIEEPDIEIGQGVSSKAISRKMPTNSARNGPRSNKPSEFDRPQGNNPNMVPLNVNNNNNPLAQLFNGGQAQQPAMPQQAMPQQAMPQQFPQMGFPGAPMQQPDMNQFAQMMAAMQQMQGGAPQGGAPQGGQPDMGNMLANIANMMRQNQK